MMINENNPVLELADEYIRYTDCHLYLTGKAGTGKTTFLKSLRDTCSKRMVVTAPTGIAAINAGGVTLHSFFQLPFGPFVPGSDSFARSGFHRLSKEKKKIIKSLDLLIIDEISMVRADMLDGVDTVLRYHRRSNAPFGGVQLLMVGDLQQLAPVVTAKDKPILDTYYQSPYFFSSNALANTELVGIELGKIYRQSDSRFIHLLNAIRDNRDAAQAIDQLNQRFQPEVQFDDYPGYITLCTHNRQADQINSSRLAAIDRPSNHFPAEVEGEFPEHSFPTAETLELKLGSQVMFIRNDSSAEKRYYNGKLGTVTRIGETTVEVQCQGEDTSIEVEPSKWDNIEYTLDEERGEIVEKVIGAFSQYPLRLAWAITIHKSQGLTFDKVIIDAHAAFSHGQVYVALSRCRTLEGITLSSRLSDRAIHSDDAVLHFSEEVRRNQEYHRNRLAAQKHLYQQRLLLECFDFQKLDRLLSRLIGLVNKYREQIQVLGAEHLAGSQEPIRKQICVVGQSFGRQLQGLFREDFLPENDPVIVERVAKASAYFGEKMNVLFTTPFEQVQVETDNKEIRKQINRVLGFLMEEGAVKSAGVGCCKEGFSPDTYLRTVSAAEIEQTAAKTGKKKKTEVVYTEADVAHPELFQKIRQWRYDKSKELGVPAFNILFQKTLIQIVVHLPASIGELKSIKGIGKVTAERYGEELVAMVTDYRREHGITSVTLPVLEMEREVKQRTENKSKKNTKEVSIELYEQGMDIREIAEERGLTVQTIDKHMAHWVAEGRVPIEKLISDDKRQKIEQALSRIGTGSLKEVKESLGNEYSYSELYLVRASMQKGCEAGEQ